MKRIVVFLVIALLVPNSVHAATTSKPTPKSTSKTTTKKSSAAKPKVSSKKSIKKPIKKTTYRRSVRKVVKPMPSPSPKWPPANFTSSGSIYAKIPSADELKSYASNSQDVTLGLRDCEKFTCGAVFLASTNGCNWWQVDSIVTGPSKTNPGSKITLGTIRTLMGTSRAKKIIAVILKSTEPIQEGVTVGGITARCWSSAQPDGVPGNTYTPIPGANSTTTN